MLRDELPAKMIVQTSSGGNFDDWADVLVRKLCRRGQLEIESGRVR